MGYSKALPQTLQGTASQTVLSNPPQVQRVKAGKVGVWREGVSGKGRWEGVSVKGRCKCGGKGGRWECGGKVGELAIIERSEYMVS